MYFAMCVVSGIYAIVSAVCSFNFSVQVTIILGVT